MCNSCVFSFLVDRVVSWLCVIVVCSGLRDLGGFCYGGMCWLCVMVVCCSCVFWMRVLLLCFGYVLIMFAC